MKFNQQIAFKHDHGITLQWVSEDNSWLAIVTYQQEVIKKLDSNSDPDASNKEITFKKWSLINCSGPWTGLSADGNSLTIIPGFEDVRNKISGEATLILTCINNVVEGKKLFESIWKSPTMGFDDFWPEDKA